MKKSEMTPEQYKRARISYLKCYLRYRLFWYINFLTQFFGDDLQCYECGSRELFGLTFHHIDPDTKDISISTIVAAAALPKHIERMKQELPKTIPLCRACHDKYHYFYKTVLPLVEAGEYIALLTPREIKEMIMSHGGTFQMAQSAIST